MSSIKTEPDSSGSQAPEIQQDSDDDVYITHWQVNEITMSPKSDKPTDGSKEEFMPIKIVKVESVHDSSCPKKSQTIPHAGFIQACNTLGLNPELPLQKLKENLRQNSKKIVDLDLDYAKECTSIHISKLPTGFTYNVVRALIQLKSDFDVYSDTYFIDVFKNNKHIRTGECLVRFMKNSDCLQVYRDMHVIDAVNGPILVDLDLDNKITRKRDKEIREKPVIFKHLLKFIEAKSRFNQGYCQDLGASGNVIKKEIEYENATSDVPIKTEILSDQEGENNENTTNAEQSLENREENVNENETVTNKVCGSSEEPFKETRWERRKRSTVDKYFEDIPLHLKCRIVHIKNLNSRTGQVGRWPDLLREIVREKHGHNIQFQFCLVVDDSSRKPCGDALLTFRGHEDAVHARHLLDGAVVQGNKIEAVIGGGNEKSMNVTTADLKVYTHDNRKRMLEPDLDLNGEPAKKMKITETPNEDKQTEHSPAPSGDTNNTNTVTRLPLKEPKNMAYGLSEEFIKKHHIRIPLSNKVKVRCLTAAVDEAKLKEVFSLAGEIKHISIFIKPDRTPIATIEYDHPLEAVQAVSMLHEQPLYNKKMNVKMYTPQKQKPLPVGLASIGPGLGPRGKPMRGLRVYSALRHLHEMFTELGIMQRTPGNDVFYCDYVKVKCQNGSNRDFVPTPNSDEQNSSNANNLKSSERIQDNTALKSAGNSNQTESKSESKISSQNNSDRDRISTSSSANVQNSSKANNLMSKKVQNIKTLQSTGKSKISKKEIKKKFSPEMSGSSTILAIQALSNLMISQGPMASTIATKKFQSTMNTLQKLTEAHQKVALKMNQNSTAPSVDANRLNHAVNQAMNRVVQCMNSVIPNTAVQTPTENIVNPAPNSAVNNQANVSQTAYPVQNNVQLRNPEANIPTLNPIPQIIGRCVNPPQSRWDVPHPTGLNPHNIRPQMVQPSPSIPNIIPPQPIVQNLDPRISKYDPSMNPNLNRPNLIEVPVQAEPKLQKICDKGSTSEVDNSKDRSNKSQGASDKNTCETIDRIQRADMLLFKNLPPSVTTRILANKMLEMGEVKFCEVTGQGRAFVRFSTPRATERCIRLFHRSKVDGQVIEVGFL